MKISELSRACRVSKETIRYYISIGLLLPMKPEHQYTFGQREVDDLLYIQKLKDMQFNLKEIQEIITLRRTSNWIEPNVLNEYVYRLRAKRGEIKALRSSLQNVLTKIDNEIEDTLKPQKRAEHSAGVPIRALPYLMCPTCQNQLQVKNGTFCYKSIEVGSIDCTCGYHAEIQNGIILTGNRYENIYDKPDLNRELYTGLNNEFLRIYQQCCDNITQDLDSAQLKDPIILEANVNGYFYSYNHFLPVDKNALYIIIDKFPETLLMYKELIEAMDMDLDILYIADATSMYPLRHGCIDIYVDFFSCNEYQFYHPGSFVADIGHYLADDAKIFGSYMEVSRHSKSRRLLAQRYPESSKDFYYFQSHTEALKEQGFCVQSFLLKAVLKTQNQLSFSCHIDGEELKVHYYRGTRKNFTKSK